MIHLPAVPGAGVHLASHHPPCLSIYKIKWACLKLERFYWENSWKNTWISGIVRLSFYAFRQTKMNEWINLARNNAHNSYVYPRLNHLYLLDPSGSFNIAMENHPFIWANDNNSLTWNKAPLGWFLLLTMSFDVWPLVQHSTAVHSSHTSRIAGRSRISRMHHRTQAFEQCLSDAGGFHPENMSTIVDLSMKLPWKMMQNGDFSTRPRIHPELEEAKIGPRFPWFVFPYEICSCPAQFPFIQFWE